MKVRHVDLHPDEFLSAVTGEISPAELGVYWMICLLCYARGGEIDANLDWLRAKFRPGKANKGVAAALETLIASGRVYREGAKIGVRRCQEEIERALSRIREASESGSKGGRPRKTINDVAEPNPLNDEKLTTNHQPPTTTVSGEGPETDVRAEESDAEGGGKQAEVEFEAWWQRYPNKVGKGAARTKFAIARRKASQQTLLDGVDGYIATKPPDRSWCNPQTWLNQERWLDQPAAPDEIPAEGPLIEGVWQSLDDKWTTAVKHWRGGKRWVESLWGPAPGDPGCQIPSKYLIEEVA